MLKGTGQPVGKILFNLLYSHKLYIHIATIMFEKYNENKEKLCACVNRWINAAEEIGENKLAEDLKTQLSELRKLRFNIAVLGNIKRGKSTLINTLLGRKDDALSPIGSEVCTGGIVHYMDVSCLPEEEKDRTHERAYVYFKGQGRPRKIDLGEIGQYIREENNPKNTKGIDHVEVFGNFPRLRDCCLVDTPGADAVIEHHGELAYGFLPYADAIIMTILSSEALTDADQRMLEVMSKEAQRRVFYVVTRIDDEREEDRQDILDYVTQKIAQSGLECSQVYPVACKEVFDAMCDGKDQAEVDKMRQEWGVATLEKDLEEFITSESRHGRNIGDQLRDSLSRLKSALNRKFESNTAIIKQQEVDVSQIEAERKQADEKFKQCCRAVRERVAKFEREWDRCTRSQLSKLENMIPSLEDKLKVALGRAGTFGALFNLFSVSSVVQKTIQQPIADFLVDASDKYMKIVDNLREEIDEEVEIYKGQISDSLHIDTWASGGIILTATGAAVVAAGNAVGAVATAAASYASVTAAGASQGVLASIWTWFVGSSTATAATSGLVTAVTGAIFPVIVAVLAWNLTGPLAKYFAGISGGKTIEKAVGEVKVNFTKQLEEKKELIVEQINEQFSEAEKKRNSELDALEEKLRNLSPEMKQKSIDENNRIEALLQEEGEDENFIRNQIELV